MDLPFFPFPVREFNDRGIKWLLSQPAHLHHLLAITLGEEAERIDWDGLRPFPTESLSDTLRRQLADLIFTAPFRGQPEQEVTIFILVEHQSTPSRAMCFRVLLYMVQLWDAQRQQWEREHLPEGQWRFRPIVPVVFYTGSGRWERVLGLEELMEEGAGALARFVPHFDLLFLNLKATTPEQLSATQHAFGHLLRVMRRDEASLEEFQQVVGDAAEQIEAMTAQDLEEWRRLAHYIGLLISYRRAPEEREVLLSILETCHRDRLRREELANMGKTIAQQLIEEGRETGIKEGEAKGRLMILLNMLRAKFGELPPEVEERLQRLSVAELDQVAVRLIQAGSLQELGLL